MVKGRFLSCAFTTYIALATALALFSAGPALAVDADGYGLNDDVELTLGSNPAHKDIFIQVDWLVVNGRSMKPRDGLIAILQNSFAVAPVSNPDGLPGITVHVELGNEIVDSREAIGYMDAGYNYDWNDFDAIKAAYLNPAHVNTHHYCLFAKCIGGQGGAPTTISGISRNNLTNFTAGASDFIVALGADAWHNWPNSSLYYLIQSGTFMHELGHDIGLRHGGVDHVNWKPNFLSVMNYTFQLWGVLNNKHSIYDYSRIQLPDLNEKKLNETKGLGSNAAGYGTGWYYSKGHGSYVYHEVLDATKKIDWNVDRKIKSSVKADISHDGAYCTLKGGYNEWAHIVFTGGAIGHTGMRASLPRVAGSGCLTFEDVKRQSIPRQRL